MPSYSAQGLVIHRLNLGETDKICTLFTREFGKLSAVVKGARKAGSRLSGATELFTQSRFLLASGKSLDIVTQCEIDAVYSDLRLDLERLARASYYCELLDRFTLERDAITSAELFDVTVDALKRLQAAATDDLDLAVHAYELRLLDALGYAPVLDRCVRCDGPLYGKLCGFSPILGGTLCASDRFKAEDAQALSLPAIELLQALAQSEDSDLPAPPDAKTAAELNRALRWYIRFRAERDLRTADFLDQLRAGS